MSAPTYIVTSQSDTARCLIGQNCYIVPLINDQYSTYLPIELAGKISQADYQNMMTNINSMYRDYPMNYHWSVAILFPIWVGLICYSAIWRKIKTPGIVLAMNCTATTREKGFEVRYDDAVGLYIKFASNQILG